MIGGAGPFARHHRCTQRPLRGAGRAAVSRTPVPCPLPLQLGPTGGAADRFGVEAAICGVVKLPLALSTQRKARQAGVGAGVGLGAGDRIARPALAAADERVAVAAVGGVLELRQTGGTGGQIGDERRGKQARRRRNEGREPLGRQWLKSAGGCNAWGKRRTSSSSERRSPCNSSLTAPATFSTTPTSSSSLARRCTNGRKPTPCTTPRHQRRSRAALIAPGR